MWKTLTGIFPIWRKPRPAGESTVKNKEKSSTFFFIKGKMHVLTPMFFQQKTGSFTGCISGQFFCGGKLCGKSGKHRWKLPPLFHINGGKLGGKSEKIPHKGGFVTLFGCDDSGTGEICAVVYQYRNKVFPSPSFLECPAQSWYNTIDILQILSGRETA